MEPVDEPGSRALLAELRPRVEEFAHIFGIFF
jgi:hypothetical protein